MLTDEFKEGLRKMTVEIFDHCERFTITASLLEQKMVQSNIGQTLCVAAPITMSEDLYQFYEDEGLGVAKIAPNAFVVSQDC